jgi:hypothetical protein
MQRSAPSQTTQNRPFFHADDTTIGLQTMGKLDGGKET